MLFHDKFTVWRAKGYSLLDEKIYNEDPEFYRGKIIFKVGYRPNIHGDEVTAKDITILYANVFFDEGTRFTRGWEHRESDSQDFVIKQVLSSSSPYTKRSVNKYYIL